MALKNITTGQPVSNMKNLTDQQTLIGQQAMQIYSLTSQNSQMVEKIMNLEKKLSEKENQKNIIENLNERLNDAENQLGNVKKELEKERNKPPRYEYRYYDKCFSCKKSEYDEKIAETSKNHNDSVVDRKKAEEELAEAKKLRAYHEDVINERVKEIVHDKTRLERFDDYISCIWSGVNVLVFIVPFLYSLGVTILAVIRNKELQVDFVEALKMLGTLLVNVFCGVRTFICWVAGFSSGISSESVSLILWWIIVVFLTIIIAALILVILGIIGFILVESIKGWIKVNYKEILAVILTDLGLITFCGDLIKGLLPLNLILLFFIIFAAYPVIKYIIPMLIYVIGEKFQRKE